MSLSPRPEGRFIYRRARSLEEAVGLLQGNAGAKVLAGGQSLMPMINLRLASPAMLVDIGHIRDLDYVRMADGVLEVGALTRHHSLEQSDLVRRHVPVLAEAARHIAHMQVRNRGTMGGSLSHADPSAELPLMAVVLEASVRVRGPRGARDIPADQFFQGIFTTALQADEILEQVRFPVPPAERRWAFAEQVLRHGDFPLVAVAVLFDVEDGRVARPVVALGAVAATPLRARGAERALAGQAATAQAFRAAAEAAAAEVDPPDAFHAGAAYRREMVCVFTRRALESAASRQKGTT